MAIGGFGEYRWIKTDNNQSFRVIAKYIERGWFFFCSRYEAEILTTKYNSITSQLQRPGIITRIFREQSWLVKYIKSVTPLLLLFDIKPSNTVIGVKVIEGWLELFDVWISNEKYNLKYNHRFPRFTFEVDGVEYHTTDDEIKNSRNIHKSAKELVFDAIELMKQIQLLREPIHYKYVYAFNKLAVVANSSGQHTPGTHRIRRLVLTKRE